jgi:hypothetical protein
VVWLAVEMNSRQMAGPEDVYGVAPLAPPDTYALGHPCQLVESVANESLIHWQRT